MSPINVTSYYVLQISDHWPLFLPFVFLFYRHVVVMGILVSTIEEKKAHRYHRCEWVGVCVCVCACDVCVNVYTSSDNISLKIMSFNSNVISNMIRHYRQSLACFAGKPCTLHTVHWTYTIFVAIYINGIYQLTTDLLFGRWFHITKLQMYLCRNLSTKFHRETYRYTCHHHSCAIQYR